MKIAIIQRKTRMACLAAAMAFLGMLAMFPESAFAAHDQAQNSRGGRGHRRREGLHAGRRSMEDATVLMHGGKIAAVGSSIQVPAGAQVIDAKGLEVYPGLFDPITRSDCRRSVRFAEQWMFPISAIFVRSWRRPAR